MIKLALEESDWIDVDEWETGASTDKKRKHKNLRISTAFAKLFKFKSGSFKIF